MKNNQLIVANENTFVGKFKRFFHNIRIKLFGHKENTMIEEQVEKNSDNNYVQNEEKNRFMNELKANPKVTNSVVEKNKFLEEIKGNREALGMLSTDRLRKLSKYYDEVIEKNNNIIKQLKKSA